MFRLINNFRDSFRNNLWKVFSKRTEAPANRSGQVAVIMIVVITIGLVLFAASINLTVMSQSKTLTMKAASSSSTAMASMLASYGERLFQETLGGELEQCHKTTGFGPLLFIIMVVIAVVFMQPELIPAALAPMAASIAAGAVIGAVMEAASIIIMATIDPGIADMWNKMQNKNLSQTGQFVERGIQAALQNSVTDQVKLPDLYDLDQDGLFGYPGNDETKPPLDSISRFSLYNTQRFLDLTPVDTTAVENFQKALHNFVLQDTDNWGLFDPIFYPNLPPDPRSPVLPPCSDANHPCCKGMADVDHFPAECDLCCQHTEGAAPAYCYTPGSSNNLQGVAQIGDTLKCLARSPYRDAANPNDMIYDPAYENSKNPFMSFREQLGRDDEHRLYHVSQTNPNWHSDPVNGVQIINTGVSDQGFFLKDAISYYTYPTAPAPDQWTSNVPPVSPEFYPFLYKMADWGPELDNLTYSNYEGHWCDSRSGLPVPGDLSPEIGRLNLGTLPVGVDPASLTNISGGWCVDRANKRGPLNTNANIGPNDPPLLADNVPVISGLQVSQSQCGFNYNPTPVSDLSQYVRGWKRGADQYCAAGAPYDVDCPKHINTDPNTNGNLPCGAPGTDPTQWPDDVMDQIISGAPVLLAMESNLFRQINTGVGKVTLTRTLPDWYPSIADWIEPPCPDPANCPGSFTKLPRPGVLWVWREELKFFNDKIQKWLKPDAGEEYSGPATTCAGPTTVWCIPGELDPVAHTECPQVSAVEAATFDANANGVRGDLYDVTQCLKWNTDDSVTLTDSGGSPVTVTGNAAKFKFCHDNCNEANCTNLPRSLVPSYYVASNFVSGKPAYQFDRGNGEDAALFNTCLTASNTISDCDANCANTVIPTGAPYDSHFAGAGVNYSAPNLGNVQAIEDWCTNPVGPPPACNGAMVLDCATNKSVCECSWANSCGGFAGCGGDPSWANAVTDALTQANTAPPTGSCADSAFKPIMQASADAAKIQVEKFKHRLAFLDGRYKEAMSLSNAASMAMEPTLPLDGILTTAIQKITDFIDGGTDFTTNSDDSPSEKFIKGRATLTGADTGDLPAFGLYVWQDADPNKSNPAGNPRWSDDTGMGGGQGYWHAVKVEVNIPRRCEGDCGDWEWPKVVSHESSGGGLFSTWHKICYKLEHLSGMTKARVIRYDQDKDLRGLIFPGGQKIWQSRLSNPLQGTEPSPTNLREACAELIDQDLAGWLANTEDPRSKLGAAFMFNRVPRIEMQGQNNPEGKYADCWKWVHEALLDHGIESKSCAEYYFAGTGFRVKFVPCKDW